MLTLINTNKMTPLIGPVGLDYIAGSVKNTGVDGVELVDLALVEEPIKVLKEYFSVHQPELIGISFRNVDDCFWPSAEWFVPALKEVIKNLRILSDSPIVIGGVGFSIFAESIVEYTEADFGIRGDGEKTILDLLKQLKDKREFSKVVGLVWRYDGVVRSNKPAWPEKLSLATRRDAIDNSAYFKRGGQCGLETKRGCNRECIYCADPLAKGTKLRLRDPAEVADEAESLLSQGIDVFHLCDSEFNIPRNHAVAVCEEFTRRGLGQKVKWYTYMSIVPFDEQLGSLMLGAGCVGIDFTTDSASSMMLSRYCHQYNKENISRAVKICKDNKITCMIDLLLGGPGETEGSVRETIEFLKRLGPDCVGSALGVRIYPGTKMAKIVEGMPEESLKGNIYRKYHGPIDFFKPTFYISQNLGNRAAELVKNFIAGDNRFFEPTIPTEEKQHNISNYNYNQNEVLVEAIEKGARGAYWDILRKLRK